MIGCFSRRDPTYSFSIACPCRILRKSVHWRSGSSSTSTRFEPAGTGKNEREHRERGDNKHKVEHLTGGHGIIL
jgi:hypothetical protein